jgi:hypothetical protein
MSRIRFSFLLAVILLNIKLSHPGLTDGNRNLIILKGRTGVEAVFEVSDSTCRWIAHRDVGSGRCWDISGPYYRLLTKDGKQASGDEKRYTRILKDPIQLTLETDISDPPLTVRQNYSFCQDGKTLRVRTSLRSGNEALTIQEISLLEIVVAGEKFRLTGPGHVSFPIFGERIFAGVEHPSAECRAQGDTLSVSQSPFTQLTDDWIEFPAAIIGTASAQDFSLAGEEGLRRAFISYLDGVRIKPEDIHVHYNDWWTAPQPSSETFVLTNIEELKKNLYDRTGFFFDSYALDEGWADRHAVWEINKNNFPDGFHKIRQSLARLGSRPGLWISPGSLYPNSLDNLWLEKQGYEVTPNDRIGLNACMAIGGKYQTTLKNVLLKHVRAADLAHVKFDGFIPSCNVPTHGHPTGLASYLPITDGMIDIFQALREADKNIALEPTCFGYQASPWWLMHVPFIIGPFGDDSPKGRCPSPEWIEAMTTARDIRNLEGRDKFLMPGSALQCFDIVVQCPGLFQNHAVMAVGRGRWFISCYINPTFMDAAEWQFFSDLMVWTRYNREFLQEPLPIGGDPALRQAYGYAFINPSRELYCLRNPWMAETSVQIPATLLSSFPREIRTIYPRRQILARLKADEVSLSVHLGPYDTKFVEIVPIDSSQAENDLEQEQETGATVDWHPRQTPSVETITFKSGTEPFGLNWSSPQGDTQAIRIFKLEGELEIKDWITSDLYILCEGLTVKSAFPQAELTIDGTKSPFQVSRSVGSFFAGGYTDEDWVWFKSPLSAGRHHLLIQVKAFTPSANFAVFLCGSVAAPPSPPVFESGPAFPLFHPEFVECSYALVIPGGNEMDILAPRSVLSPVERIDGVYLDALGWISATVGWGKIHINGTVKGQPMTMGGQIFHRGIGTHAFSKIVYHCPEDITTFAATIGCDQKALVGSVVFVLEGDGRELFRSPVLRADSTPLDITVPVRGISELALIVEDGGDRIAADHGNWANARFLKSDH